MISPLCLSVLLAVSFAAHLTLPQKLSQKLPQNGGFEEGLSGWKTEGEVSIDRSSPIKGKVSARIGPGSGALRQRYDVPGLRVLNYNADLRVSSPSVTALVRLQCFDKHGHLLMNLTCGPDRQKAVNPAGSGAGVYLKTHAFTSYVVLSIEKSSGAGTVSVDSVNLDDDDRGRVEHPPQVDLDAYMRPIWNSETVVNESVLLLSRDGGEPFGRLLFDPTDVLAVKDSSLKELYIPAKDYIVQGKSIFAIAGSSIPTMSDSEFPKGQFPWANLAGRHIFVTYRHKEAWRGPIAGYQGSLLPETVRRLSGRKPLTVVAYGDSITLGINVSGFRNVPPYMPPWPSLVARQLRKIYGNPKVKIYNTGLGGMTSQRAKDNAREAVASLSPNLVLIAFGMNDFWSLTPDQFAANIRDTMTTVRAKNPKVEFILIAPMKFDPSYTTDPTYVGNLTGYLGALKTLVAPGVALFDMTSQSEALYRAKSAKDLETDPMHPDDFLARWMAQGLVAMLDDRPMGRGEPLIEANPNHVISKALPSSVP